MRLQRSEETRAAPEPQDLRTVPLSDPDRKFQTLGTITFCAHVAWFNSGGRISAHGGRNPTDLVVRRLTAPFTAHRTVKAQKPLRVLDALVNRLGSAARSTDRWKAANARHAGDSSKQCPLCAAALTSDPWWFWIGTEARTVAGLPPPTTIKLLTRDLDGPGAKTFQGCDGCLQWVTTMAVEPPPFWQHCTRIIRGLSCASDALGSELDDILQDVTAFVQRKTTHIDDKVRMNVGCTT